LEDGANGRAKRGTQTARFDRRNVADLGLGSVATEDGIGDVDSGPAVLRTGAAKRIGACAAGVVKSVGDGLPHVRIEADDDAGWPVQNRTAKRAPANVTLRG